MSVAIGQLKHRLAIQATSEAQDGMGGVEETWATEVTRWGKVKPLSGRELLQAQQLQSKVTHEIILRYDSNITVDVARRILYGARVFEIHAVINIDEGNRYYKLLCSELT